LKNEPHETNKEIKERFSMKKVVQMLLVFASVAEIFAQSTFYVSPIGYANVEGNSSTTNLFSTGFSQFQQVYSASEFDIPAGASGLVTSVAFRIDGAAGQSFSGFWPGASISLSTTPNSPSALSPVYANNGSANSVQVFSGPFLIRATNTSLFPRSFEVQISFSTPFWYDPSLGNLSMYIGSLAGPANLVLDAQDSFGDGVGRVYGSDGSGMGTVDSLGVMTRFGMMVIPEPSVISLFIIAFATLAVANGVRKKKP
jgi:hypothetical protein